MQDFAEKVVVITGGASGIGLGLARRFADEGAKIVLGDVEEPALRAIEATLAEGGADVLGVPCDVSSAEQMQSLADRALERHGAVHVFCNNAGVGGGGLSWDAPLSTWNWVLDVDLWGPIHGVRTFVPLLMEHDDAHIVNTASVAGLVSAPMLGPYNVAKHGVVALAETLYREMQLHGGAVKVHVLCPGWVRTKIHESARNRSEEYGAGDAAEEGMAEVLRTVIDRGMDPTEVADHVVSAMREERFWILTHRGDKWTAGVHSVLDSIRDGANPPIFEPPI